MKPTKPMEAEKLLGGYATGTLTEAERRRLFEAALDRQDLFDALVDEESLREALADPAVKAQLIEALSSTPGKVVPLWRRPGILGAAASLLVASLAGLAYLRSPEEKPASAKQAAEVNALAGTSAVSAKPFAEAAPHAESAGVAANQAQAAGGERTQPKKAPKALAEEVAAPVVLSEAKAGAAFAPESVKSETIQTEKRKTETRLAQDVESAKVVASLLRTEDPDRRAKTSEAPAPLPASAAVATVAELSPGVAAAAPKESRPAPLWSLVTLPDGSTRVTVKAPPGSHAVLLRRGGTGVEALKPQAPWRWQVRLNPGDVLDLYLLNRPVADPAKLPETGPVDGFRARIHPK